MRRTTAGTWDHPRSRGVYDGQVGGGLRAVGSSPLARGLPIAVFARRLAERIIPARAGFTDVDGGGDLAHGDHPRSRGVYTVSSDGRASNKGSSPLARGLLIDYCNRFGDDGIIPARAGFTA